DAAKIDKLKIGNIIEVNYKQLRNPAFLKKFFSLIDIAYSAWEPGEINSDYGAPQKNPEAFREWLIIKAGFFDVYSWPNGKIRIEAKSIAFENMSEETFAQLYSNVIDVILKDVLHNYKKPDLDNLVMQIIGFA
ncbi:MAG: DUF1367 family protein, partial [Gammaproteobacteria bacterium]|nr:DUF1367 family protein [Gammaproteobacteria bacterium]